MRVRYTIVSLMILLTTTAVQGQINISGKVFGGARQADVGGHTYVSIGAEKHDVVINAVYGGNDISGIIGSSTKPAGVDDGNHVTGLDKYNTFVRTDKESDGKHLFIGQLFGGGYGNYTYKNENSGKYDVEWTVTDWDGSSETYVSKTIALDNIFKPEIDKTYVDLHGGTFGYTFGGGDNVTVKGIANICINNESTRTKTADEEGGLPLLTTQRLKDMGINTEYYNKIDNHIAGVDKFLFSRVFGGNNKADMRILPTWHLQAGSIENLYSGGNEGRMTSPQGLLLEIGSKTEASNINVYNVYGGCRKADVRPLNNDGTDVTHVYNLENYSFPHEFAARVLVRSGQIHNVYGGNDVRGRVYFGNAIGIYCSISGDVYGGGNGSYPYTDNEDLANDLIYGDFYYNPSTELTNASVTAESGLESVTALNLVRPNAEQVSIRIADSRVTDELSDAEFDALKSTPVIIGGSVYCGGNSATLKMDESHRAISNDYPLVELKIGSNIIVDNVFLGNNGVNMVDQSAGGLLAQYNGKVTDAEYDPTGTDEQKAAHTHDFSTIDMTTPKVFDEYMKGCAMDIIPSVNFDSKALNNDPATYRDYSAYIGSFYCGGNVGSMTYNDVKPMTFDRKFIIFDKLVGGCNNATIPRKEGVNALYEGGLTGLPNTTSGNKVELTLSGIKIEPKRWKNPSDKVQGLEWNTIFSSTGENTDAILTTEPFDAGKDYHLSTDNDLDRRFQNGHIYGGCYSSGYVNGNVVINIDGHLMEREKLFDVVMTDNLGEEESLYGEDQTQQERFKIIERKTGVLLAQQGMDVLGAALNVFGGGKGKGTEIWGSTTINLNRGYTFQIFGGSEEGVIGKPDDGSGMGDAYTYSYDLPFIGLDETEKADLIADGKPISQQITKTYKYNSRFSCYVNLCGANAGVSKRADQSEDMAECEFMYGGGFLGPICGNTYVNLGKGRIFNSFAGSCNADILGHTETYIGRMVKAGSQSNPYQYKNVLSSHAADASYYEEGFPWIRDYTYGGNDLGGRIMQRVDFSSKVRNEDIKGMVYKNNASTVLTANAYTEYLQGRAEGIFGGCYGTYDYTDPKYKDYFFTATKNADGTIATYSTGANAANLSDAKPGYSKPYIENAFVNFRPTYSQSNNKVNKIYGAGQGYPDEKDRDHLQDYSYVLIDIPENMAYYQTMEVFGAGAWSGVGMREILWPNLNPTQEQSIELDHHSTIIDLVRGQIGAAYGGSYAEGITRRTMVNVPDGSTITIGSIFGGAYGTKTLPTCDVLDANVEYHSATATLVYDPGTSDLYQGSLYGGNNNERRTLSAYVNIDVPVVQRKVIQYDGEIGNMTKGQELMSHGTVYGAGRGKNTWSEYTMVNLDRNAVVWEVYGGGQLGHVLNAQTVQQYMQIYKTNPSPEIPTSEYTNWETAWQKAWKMDKFFPNDTYNFDNYALFIANQLNGARARTELDDKTAALLGDGSKFFNTNVIIREGATVNNYAYGGGLGKSGVANSGDVWGTTYIALLGGTVKKDLYAAGTSGGVCDALAVGARSGSNPLGFTASANAYIQGGTARNVYGGGWEGSVGKHKKVVTTEDGQQVEVDAEISYSYSNDIPGETNVVIGIPEEDLDLSTANVNYLRNGIPAIERNAYGGGEGGAVFGTTHLTMRNGYIGYRFFDSESDLEQHNGEVVPYETKTINNWTGYYQEKLHDETWSGDGTNRLNGSGCIFGGGYVDNSSVDNTRVKMYGGHVRNALFGGGEIAAIGRGTIVASGTDKSVRTLTGIYKAGTTLIELFDGHVHRNVFGGGRGYNNLGETGTLYSDGYVFGQTEVHIHGGEIGTDKELALGNGNVFGGGDVGYVYSAYELSDGTLRRGIKSGARYDGTYEGYYYEHKGKNKNGADETSVTTDADGYIMYTGNERKLTEDCKVLIEPHCKVTAAGGMSFDLSYEEGDVFTVTDIDYLREYNKTHTPTIDVDAISAKIDVKGKVNSNFSFTLNFAEGEYVPTFAMNILGDKTDSSWAKLEADRDEDGIIIHNAVFAGGNTSSGSSKAYANATSVFGNATASVHDVYHRDLITIGTGRTGGLYGDGNLTFVDGYRGLNITNYGTDYYYLYHPQRKEITYNEYLDLLDREAAYYEVRYECTRECTDKDGTTYHPKGGEHTSASTLSYDDILTLFKDVRNPNYDIEHNPDTQEPEFTYTVPEYFYNSDGSINTSESNGYWKQAGVCSIYAGRLMNTIQRADFCGVFGSRMVMQGAEDRVPEVVDYTHYTINRVREVSLNKKLSDRTADATTDEAFHGNYFGIYNIVNYLGALTSDFDFGDQGSNTDEQDATGEKQYQGDKGTGGVRTSDNNRSDEYGPDYTGQTFYGWKRAHADEQKRNNGNSHNKVALASGVYLELTTEQSTGKELNEKVWGPITGVVELDLINVQPGIGGGFVYAKNIHGKRTKTNHINTTLTALNAGAVTRFDYDYSTIENNANQREWQTSGNFVHSTQTIIDDCYNVSGKYMGTDKVPAHYWYIKGNIYVYDQYISAYTGMSNAYSETVDIPLTITAASHGTMTLLQVQPNKYAYYNTTGAKLGENQKLVINDVDYHLNDPINYWDWYKLTPSEQNLFVDETYVVSDDCWIGETEYKAGQVLLPSEYSALSSSEVYQKKENDDGTVENVSVAFSDMFHMSNNLSHETGYMLTYKVNNPVEWNTWYTKEISQTHEKNQTSLDDPAYHNGPTYYLNSANPALLGQRDYSAGDLISESTYNTYMGIKNNADATIRSSIPSSGQAEFELAWILTAKTTVSDGGQERHLNKGYVMSDTEKTRLGLVAPTVTAAYICNKSIQLSSTEYIYVGTRMTEAEKIDYIGRINAEIEKLPGIVDAYNITDAQKEALTDAQRRELFSLLNTRKDMTDQIVPAYYCKTPGLYGGDYYVQDKNYRGLDVFSSMEKTDRDQFTFNYDALDLLVDPTYGRAEGKKYQYDSAAGTLENAQKNLATDPNTPAGYSIEMPVDYTATYNGDTEETLYNGIKLEENKEYSRQEYEKLPNERRHYAPITVKNEDVAGGSYTVYVVKSPDLVVGNTPYAVGSTLAAGDYSTSLDDKVIPLTFTTAGTYYFCRESYKIGENGSGKSVKAVMAVDNVCAVNDTKSDGETVPVGFVIAEKNSDNTVENCYNSLVNKQLNFTIHGKAPTETSTFYVSRFSDIKDLSTEKIITVIYRYDYEESDKLGNHITPVSERHVVNIHITFKSGLPEVEDIQAPELILPGDYVGLNEPRVIPGATEITGGGWELYERREDAESRTNPIPYEPSYDPLYWYQDGYFVRYYCLTNIGGKSYSNYVPVSVANYHDLKKVMDDKDHHYYVDNPNVKRDSKVYINDYSSSNQNGLDLLKDLFDLSIGEPLTGHASLDDHVKAGKNLDFILRTDIDHSGTPWTPIGRADDLSTTTVDESECFDGTLHGDGHHLSGLDQSLFLDLCGEVYNLGVSGSFTSAGVADLDTRQEGYVENCWVKSTATTTDANPKPYAVFGAPSDNEGKQIVNSYFWIGNKDLYNTSITDDVTTSGGDRGTARAMTEREFYNGTVAYNLNGFYLHKRFYDNNTTWGGTKKSYGYLVPNADGTLPDVMAVGYYPDTYAFYPLEAATDKKLRGYVEERFADGDFRYSAGSIPDDEQRMRMVEEIDNGETVAKPYFAPIWPDDYFFFGQTLSYGYETGRTHQDVPTSYATTNRVYRAPAYFRSYDMGVAHFNANAVFSQSKKGDATKEAYKNMTAIDFTGYNDSDRGYDYLEGWSTWSKTSQQAQSEGKSLDEYAFFPPLLDEGVTTTGLTSFISPDLTSNLLVYTDAPGGTGSNETPTGVQKTANVVSSYLADAAYDDHETDTKYHTVKAWDSFAGVLHGHWVQKSGNDYVSYRDHMLVDKQDFNAPIAYTFGDNYRMWHQRLPENYVDLKKGWEAISLPFAAEIVTTNQKGEITHFYNESYDYFDYDISKKDGTSTKVGHEYWLREFTDIKEEVVENTSTTIATANFKYPAVVGDGSVIINKTVTNTFLWDYYYKGVSHNQNDHNRDIYQEYYNDDSRDYDNYPLLTNGIPYIIGFPGTTYYEFDLSGGFSAGTTAETKPQELEKQTITFASQKGTMIQVSDLETVGVSRDYNGKTYTFKPSYLNMAFEAGSDIYTLNAGGNEYNKVPAAPGQSESAVPDTEVSAFRPYFVSKVTNNNNQGNTRTIVFGNEQQEDQIIEQHGDPTKEELNGGLHIYTRKGKIYVKSSLSFTEDLRVVTPAGVAVATLTVKPGQTVEVQADFSGMYVVHTLDGQYVKKVAVKRE